MVSTITSPEYISLMKNARGIVTDKGSILSHAAIVSRELKKPCIVGTGLATKNLKDGDLIEMDAKTGKITLIKKLASA